MNIGFIGQGFIGKSYADDYKKRGYDVVRIDIDSTEKEKAKIKRCDIVFIAVPTPTINRKVDITNIQESLDIIGADRIAVIKSTIPPHTVTALQEQYPDLYVMHSPEFLRAKTAGKDASKPARNIIGISSRSGSRKRAEMVMKTLPMARKKHIIPSTDAEMIKYTGNVYLVLKVIFANIIHDLCQSINADPDIVLRIVSEDPRIGSSHFSVFDEEEKRGAGGLCFIKDLSAFNGLMQMVNDENMKAFLLFAEALNINLLVSTGKDTDIVKAVYE